jgi:hypothetical protein
MTKTPCCKTPLKRVQLGLHKRTLSYDFSFYIGRTGHIPKNFRSAALSTDTTMVIGGTSYSTSQLARILQIGAPKVLNRS